MTEVVDQVERLVRLAWLRRQRALTDRESADIDRLTTALAEQVEGIGLRQQRQSSADLPAPVPDLARDGAAPPSPSAGTSPATRSADAAAPKRPAHAEPALPEGPGEPVKVPTSAYTPPSERPFLGDYYGDLGELAPSALPATRLVDAEGQELPAEGDARWLLSADIFGPPDSGDDEAGTGPSRPGRTGAGSKGTGSTGSSGPSPQAIVHLVSGGSVRGEIRRFKPLEGAVQVHGPKGPVSVPTPQVLAVFLTNLRKPPPDEGRPVAVLLQNEKELRGKTRDYRKDGTAFMLVPSPRRGAVDCVWIPNRSVKRIQSA